MEPKTCLDTVMAKVHVIRTAYRRHSVTLTLKPMEFSI